MARDLLMPKLGLTMTEGVVNEWLVSPGDRFSAGAALFVIESDKAASEIAADADGTLDTILVPAGETVECGHVVGRWLAPGDMAVPPALSSVAINAPGREAPPSPIPPARSNPVRSDRIMASPFARRLAGEQGIDLHDVVASGAHGRIKGRDVLTARDMLIARAERSGEPRKAPVPMPLPSSRPASAWHRIAEQADLTALTAVQEELAVLGKSIPFICWVLAAVGRALVDHPEADRVLENGELADLAAADVGFMLDTPDGAAMSVIRSAGKLPLGGIVRQAAALITLRQTGDDGAGPAQRVALGVACAGPQGATFFMPAVSANQTGQVSAGRISTAYRPDATGCPSLRRESTVAMTVDPRVLSAGAAERFLRSVTDYLEQPLVLLAT